MGLPLSLHKLFASPTGLIFGAVGLGLEAVSIGINHEYMASIGGWYGWAFILADLVKLILFGEIVRLIVLRRFGFAFFYSLIWMGALCLSFAASASYAKKNFGDKAAERAQTIAKASGVSDDLKEARLQMKGLPAGRSSAEIEAEIAALPNSIDGRSSALVKIDLEATQGRIELPAWRTTAECTNTSAKGASSICAPYLRVKKEMVAAAEREERAAKFAILLAEKGAAQRYEALQARVADLSAKQIAAPIVGSANPTEDGISEALAGALTPAQVSIVLLWLTVTVFPIGGPVLLAISREHYAEAWTVTTQPAPVTHGVRDDIALSQIETVTPPCATVTFDERPPEPPVTTPPKNPKKDKGLNGGRRDAGRKPTMTLDELRSEVDALDGRIRRGDGNVSEMRKELTRLKTNLRSRMRTLRQNDAMRDAVSRKVVRLQT